MPLSVEEIHQKLQLLLQNTAPLRDVIGHDLHPRLLGRLTGIQVLDRDTHEALDAIPSETTALERRFLRNFFASFWAGRHSVLEIGPFMGGTTRAIALGMLANPSRQPHCRLKTFDKFSDYHTTESLRSFCGPLIDNGTLPATLFDELGDGTPWKDIYTRIHGSAPYGHLIDIATGSLPDHPADPVPPGDLFRLDPADTFDAVFIDGCKSWYGTKTFMMETLPRTTPDCWFIFQDFGWKSCFWIPAFIALTRPALATMAFVDATYAFRLTRALTPADVERVFPDSPEELGADRLMGIFDELIREAMTMSDTKSLYMLHLQKAAAAAYIGDLDGARTQLDAMAADPMFAAHAGEILSARRCPTYRPDGPVML